MCKQFPPTNASIVSMPENKMEGLFHAFCSDDALDVTKLHETLSQPVNAYTESGNVDMMSQFPRCTVLLCNFWTAMYGWRRWQKSFDSHFLDCWFLLPRGHQMRGSVLTLQLFFCIRDRCIDSCTSVDQKCWQSNSSIMAWPLRKELGSLLSR